MRTELHFHLLPAVDDGPRSDDEALELARLAVADGTGRIVATPHAHAIAPRDVMLHVAALNALLGASGVPLTVVPGIELLPSDVLRFAARDLERVAHGPPGRRWVLLEASLERPEPDTTAEALAKLQTLGLGALIAHPERSAEWWTDEPLLDLVIAAGARLQVNASSLTGFHGPDAQRRALSLALGGRIDVLASDAHSEHRPPCLTAALAVLARHGVDGEPLVAARPQALLSEGIQPLAAKPLAA